MKRAVIDIGSNSVLLLAGELSADGSKLTNELLNLSFITSLGKDLDKTKKFHEESMSLTFDALVEYKAQLEKIQMSPEQVIVTATEAARVATNSSEFFLKIKRELGFIITIITSEAEAYYTALGVASGSDDEQEVVVMDIGGASTELIKLHLKPFKITSSISLPVGAVRATDWIKEGIFENKMSELLKNDLSPYCAKTLLCVAGGMTSIAAMYQGQREFDAATVEGMNIDFINFDKFSTDLQNTNTENLILLFPFLGKRVQVIAGAAKVASIFCSNLGVEMIKISTRGLRFGTILQGKIDEKFTIR